MTNKEINVFRSCGLIDTHFHYVFALPLSETAENFRAVARHFDLRGFLLNAITRVDHRPNDPYQNVKGIYLKSLFRDEGLDVWVYGAPYHFHDARDTAEGYLAQVKKLYEMGVDGYKCLDAKPGYRKKLGRSLADPMFEPAVDFIEKKEMPAKIHVCDPKMFWGKREDMTETAIKRGWWYGDGSYPSFEGIYSELTKVLDRHPNLKLCIAHLGYLNDDPEIAVRMLESYGSLSYDLTPGASIFKSFTDDPKFWREFVEKYKKRIFFGSDTYNNSPRTAEGLEIGCERITLVRKMLEYKAEKAFAYRDLGTLVPLGLSDEALSDIYRENAYRLLGEGRRINAEAVIGEAQRLILETRAGIFDISEDEKALEISNMQTVIEYFKTKI